MIIPATAIATPVKIIAMVRGIRLTISSELSELALWLMMLCKIPDHEKSATPMDKLNNTKSPITMRLAVFINHGGMAARRSSVPRLWLALLRQDDVGKEVLGLSLA